MGNSTNDDQPQQQTHRWLYPKIIFVVLFVFGAATTISTHFQLSSSSLLLSSSGNDTGGVKVKVASSSSSSSSSNGLSDAESSSSTTISNTNANAVMDKLKTTSHSTSVGDGFTDDDDDVDANSTVSAAPLSPSTHDAINENITTTSNNASMNHHYESKNSSTSSTGHSDSSSGSSNGMHVCTCLTNTHPMNSNLSPTPPKRLRWLHIPKTGTSFVSTLWSYMTTTEQRYIDLAVNSQWCSKGTTAFYSMYDFALMRRYPWEMYGAPNMIPSSSSSSSSSSGGGGGGKSTIRLDSNLPLGLVGGTQHQPLAQNLNDKSFTSSHRYQRLQKHWKKFGSEIFEHNFTVATFFRQPEDRIISAFYDGRHANGFTPELYKELIALSRIPTTSPTTTTTTKHSCKIGNVTYHNPLECYARYPGIAGCMSRMLTGETCADGLLQESGLENLPEAIDVIMNHLEFVGLMEEWNESICQFHRLYTGRIVDNQVEDSSRRGQQRRQWIPPLQGEFSNVHKSTKKQDYGLEDLHGFTDVADRVIYEAAKLKFQQMVGGEKCYRYMTWDEIIEERREKNNDDDGYLPHLKVDDDGKVCQPKSCSDLGKQCGEWDDGCGKTIICGMCNIARTGLPSTWRVKCVEGQCIDYCPPWDEKGYWFLSDNSPSVMTQITDEIAIQDRSYLSPVDAITICELACNKSNNDDSKRQGKVLKSSFVSSGLCRCGTTPKILNANLTLEDFSKAHDLNEMCSTNKARNSAILTEKETQPICCPYIDEKANPPKGWKRQYVMASVNLEGEYFDHVRIECGGFQECESVARKKKAELAVFDLFNSMCYLARNVFDLKNMYTVTKDNQYRYSLELR